MALKCLLLMAGLGTRMGVKGKYLPKGLWPLYNYKIIDWQVLYLRSLGIEDIWVNVFYHHEMFLEYQKRSPFLKDVHFLIEKELLDVGGSVHFFAQNHPQGYNGKVYVCAGDQFLPMTQFTISEIENLSTNNPNSHILTSVKVNKNSGLNAININNQNVLTSITQFDTIEQTINEYQTYSGFSLIQLNNLPKHFGVGKFFEVVCNFNTFKVLVHPIAQTIQQPYWDFGTNTRYYGCIHQLNKLAQRPEPFKSITIESLGQISTHK